MTPTIAQAHRTRYVVVVGVDFSNVSTDALNEGVKLVQGAEGAELHLVHVVVTPVPPASVGAMVAPELAYLTEVDQAGVALQRLMGSLQLDSVRLSGHVRVGRPDREIAQVASDVAADLVVVGSHGHRGLERLLLGSVAESLVRRAPCAVLVHRPRSVPAWELIEPPCPDCSSVQKKTHGATLWCVRHSEHHVRAHTYHEYPESFGMGAQTFRS